MVHWLRQSLFHSYRLSHKSGLINLSIVRRGTSRLYSSGTKPLAPQAGYGLPIPKGQSDRYIAVFTCKVCNLRSAKSFSKQAYNNGVVYTKCSGCNNLHLISDQLGWFGESKENIEDILSRQGENVHKAELGEDISEDDIRLISSLKNSKHFD